MALTWQSTRDQSANSLAIKMTIMICNLWHSIYLIDTSVDGTDMYETLILKLSISVLIMSMSLVGYNMMVQKQLIGEIISKI